MILINIIKIIWIWIWIWMAPKPKQVDHRISSRANEELNFHMLVVCIVCAVAIPLMRLADSIQSSPAMIG
jgi:hypothetical protein